MTRRLKIFGVLAVVLLSAGCAASKAFRQGNAATHAGDLEQAVAYYRAAVQASPENPNYKIALQRAMLAASRVHMDRARDFEEHDQLEAARGEYKLSAEYDAGNRMAAAKVTELDQKIRDRIEATRPRPMDQLRQRARASSTAPILNPASREPLVMHFNGTRVGDILNTIATASGISMSFDRDAQGATDRAQTLQIDGMSLEQALNMVLQMNQLSYKVVAERSIFVFPDTVQKHAQYDDQVVQTFYVANADVTELTQILSSVVRFTGIAIQPIIQPNKASNTITVRGTSSVVQIIERIIQQNDKPHAEIVIDVEILEVNRTRAKQYGLNLSQYALGGIFSPEVAPGGTSTSTTSGGSGGSGTTTTAGTSTPPGSVVSPPPFNLNTISKGVSTADFYMAVPTGLVRFLESDTQTKLIAKPQVRATDGQKVSYRVGDKIPLPSTTFTPIATGGAGQNPLTSFQYTDVGVNLDMTPRVTVDGDIILDLVVENSTLGASITVAGVSAPTIGQRTVTTRLRLRDGESNLLAGLLREDERKQLQGFPGAISVPILKQLFSSNDNSVAQTDIVMLLTPHIIRTSEITVDDLKPIYIGSQQNLGIGGAPALIAPEIVPPTPAPAAAPSTPGIQGPGGSTLAAPPGSSPVPGTVVVPPPGSQALNAPPQAAQTTQPVTMPPAVNGPESGVAAAPNVNGANGAASLLANGMPAGAPPIDPAAASIGSAQVIVTPPGTTFRVNGGPYTVPISVVNVSRLSTISLTLAFDPALLRVRTVQEGGFMRSGGVNASFTQESSTPGRVDITVSRAADATGASGTGLLGAVLFDAIAPGSGALTLSGAATGPGGAVMGLQFRPVSVSVQP